MNVPSTQPSKVRLSARFLRQNRIVLNNDFQRVFANKTNIVSKFMVVWICEGTSGEGLRLGVVASKRTFRRAVDRNRAKRLLRESFRLNRAKINMDLDLVIIARRKILSAKRQDVEQEFIRLADEINRIPTATIIKLKGRTK